MWLDVVGYVLFGILLAFGAMRGAATTALRILALLGAYAGGFFAATSFGPQTARVLGVPDFLGAPAAGLIGCAASYLVLGMGVRGFQWWERRRRQDAPRSLADRLGGAGLGAVQGAVILLLLGWLGLFVDAGQSSGTLEVLPSVADSRLSRATQRVVEQGAEAMLDPNDAGTRVAVKVIARPRQTVENVQALLANPRLDALQRDRLFWSYVENGAIDTGLNRASFLGMAYDSHTRESFAELGLISEREASEPRLFRDAMAGVFRELGPRVKLVRNDPGLAKLLEDPEVVAALEAGDTFTLLQNEGIRDLVERVINADQADSDT